MERAWKYSDFLGFPRISTTVLGFVLGFYKETGDDFADVPTGLREHFRGAVDRVQVAMQFFRTLSPVKREPLFNPWNY